ncbi:MAG: acyltransferase [Clostridia bacterium]|nr:acyltransferase [Clostridia bacterium]
MGTEKKLYPGIDILKLVCAMLVLFMHTYCYDAGTAGAVFKSITNIGVPFFFIASGFFYGKGLARAEDKRAYFIRYFERILWMYVIWTVLSLPAYIYDLLVTKPELGPVMLILYLVRAFFLTGSMGVYWYLLSILYISVVLYIVYGHPQLTVPLYVVSVLLFIVGVIYEGGLLEDNLIGTAIHVIFGSERNFLTVGLFYMCIGWFLSGRDLRLPPMPVLLVLLAAGIGLIVADHFILPVDFCHAFAALILFLIGIAWNCPIPKKAASFVRRLSTGIYLLHFPFIIVFDLYLKKGTLIDLPVTLAFCLVVYGLCQLLPEKVRSLVFG